MEAELIYKSLTEDVVELDFTGDPAASELLLTTSKNVPIAVNGNGQVLAAASKYGKGKILVLPPHHFLKTEGFLKLILNSISWMTSGAMSSSVTVGFLSTLSELEISLKLYGYATEHSKDISTSSIKVFYCSGQNIRDADILRNFVHNGGGLIISGEPCNFTFASGNEHLFLDCSGNQITGPAGIFVSDEVDSENKVLAVAEHMPLNSSLNAYSKDNNKFLEELVEGVDSFHFNKRINSTLIVHGHLAFPVAADEDGRVVIAAGRYGRGRFLVVGHEGNNSNPKTFTFFKNCLKWLSKGANTSEEICVSSNRSFDGFYEHVKGNDFLVRRSNSFAGSGVFCSTVYAKLEASEIHEFVAAGGGLLMSGHAWHWASVNKDKNMLLDCPANIILNTLGVTMTASTANKNEYPVQLPPQGYNFRDFIHSMQKSNATDFSGLVSAVPDPGTAYQRIKQDCTLFANMARTDDLLHHSALRQMRQVFDNVDFIYPRETLNITTEKEKAVLYGINALYRATPDDILEADESKWQTITVNCKNKGPKKLWRSTGLYLPPKTVGTLRVQQDVVGTGLKIQIGCHDDDIHKREIHKRPPKVTTCFDLSHSAVNIASAWGGLIYIIIPKLTDLPNAVEFTVTNAVKAPYYIHGETDPSEWGQLLLTSPSPDVELEGEEVILTVARKQVQDLLDPRDLMDLWNKIMQAVFKLSACASTHGRKERIVADVQISAGSMHSGYPIMMHQNAVNKVTDPKLMMEKGSWGIIHELGHNRQVNDKNKPWDWEIRPHTTEATCNLWSVYVHEEIFHVSRSKAHKALSDESRRRTVQNYINNGCQLDEWKVWTCLETYLQLQEGFGWEPFQRVFKFYQVVENGNITKSERMNLFAKTFSIEVQRNLAPFFRSWGWPIEEKLAEELTSLPNWDENPMANFFKK